MARPVIVSATRTAIGTLGGALAQLPATKLGAIAGMPCGGPPSGPGRWRR